VWRHLEENVYNVIERDERPKTKQPSGTFARAEQKGNFRIRKERKSPNRLVN